MAIRSNFSVVLDRIKQAVKKSADPEQMKLLGQEAIRLITVRTRLGYGVDRPGGDKKRLKPLSPSYIEMRRKSKELSEWTEPRKSNLTYTGQMIDSLKEVPKPSGVFIEPTGSRTDGLSNQTVAGRVTSMGRAFLSLSRLEIKQLRRFFEVKILGKKLKDKGLTR